MPNYTGFDQMGGNPFLPGTTEWLKYEMEYIPNLYASYRRPDASGGPRTVGLPQRPTAVTSQQFIANQRPSFSTPLPPQIPNLGPIYGQQSQFGLQDIPQQQGTFYGPNFFPGEIGKISQNLQPTQQQNELNQGLGQFFDVGQNINPRLAALEQLRRQNRPQNV